jgi:hypothetical protein
MKTKLLTTAAGLAAMIAAAPVAAAQDSLPGDILVDMRARYENVSQTGKLSADAVTLRTRLGWQSPEWNGITFLGEIENVVPLDGDDDYNSGLNGLSQYASIKDGEFTELNRLQVGFSPVEHVSVSLGRQYLQFDDGRFVGSAGHRQDKNSHDAIQIDWADGAFEASYVYHDRINRGPGDDSDWDSDSHLFHAGYAVSDALALSGFLYLIDITEPGAVDRSNSTWGGRVTGERQYSDLAVDYAVLYARQSDYGSATTDFDLGYFAGDLAFSRGGGELAFGYDVIEGNGSTGFSNPIGKNHGVLGWADVFSGGGRQGTVDGVEDFNVMLSWGRDWERGFVRGFSTGVRHHDFEAERTGADLGNEWDAFVEFTFPEGLSLAWEMADYDGPDVAPAPADVSRNWVILSYRR